MGCFKKKNKIKPLKKQKSKIFREKSDKHINCMTCIFMGLCYGCVLF